MSSFSTIVLVAFAQHGTPSQGELTMTMCQKSDSCEITNCYALFQRFPSHPWARYTTRRRETRPKVIAGGKPGRHGSRRS